ncbi:hypothetical protein SAMN05421820_101237 [Pedobacter steynii]|uniref:Uncharacterized protein n=1 Tax=Pedobacter steynii TaxID=430522 RepID=A0A1G9JFG2_9SPHI|nr:hypothetical protein SAMN05421820_101237 [Pedobacter steynii]
MNNAFILEIIYFYYIAFAAKKETRLVSDSVSRQSQTSSTPY